MTNTTIDIKDFHWLMDVLQSIDVGLVVLDQNYDIQIFNSFMANHSGLSPERVMGKPVFEFFDEVPEQWFKRKVESVFVLKSRAFVTWEQRPYIFRFKNYRPITGAADYMYQNATFIPLMSADGSVQHVGIIIYDVTDIAVSKTELEAANSQLEALSRTDRLTQLNNRGFWEECLELEFSRIKRSGSPSSLIMFDIDHFKKVNDTYGHQAGDEVIRQTASNLLNTIRATDTAGRYGGEEFGVILPDTSAENALILTERLRKKIESLVIQYEEHTIRYTISLGIAQFDSNMDNYQQWLVSSDEALYAAKEGGRNQSVIYSDKLKKQA